MKILSLMLFIIQCAAHIFQKYPSALKRWGLIESPIDLLEGKLTTTHIDLPEGLCHYLRFNDYSLSEEKREQILSHLCQLRKEPQDHMLFQFYFSPVSTHLTHLIKNISDIKKILLTPYLEADHKNAVLRFYNQHPTYLSSVVRSTYELAELLCLLNLEQQQERAFIERHFNISKDDLFLKDCCKRLAFDIESPEASFLSIRNYTEYASTFYTTTELKIIHKIAFIYSNHISKILNRSDSLQDIIFLLSNIFIEPKLRSGVIHKMAHLPRGLCFHLNSILELQMLRCFEPELSAEDKRLIVKEARFHHHPLTEFLKIFQKESIQKVIKMALNGSPENLEQIYETGGFSLILQHAQSLTDLSLLFKNQCFSDKTRESLKKCFLQMDDETFSQLIRSSSDFLKTACMLGLSQEQKQQLSIIFKKNNGALIKKLKIKFLDLRDIAEEYHQSEGDKEMWLNIYVQQIELSDRPYVKTYQEFEQERSLLIQDQAFHTLFRIERSYWKRPLKKIYPLLSDLNDCKALWDCYKDSAYHQALQSFFQSDLICDLSLLLRLLKDKNDVDDFFRTYARHLSVSDCALALLKKQNQPHLKRLYADFNSIQHLIEKYALDNDLKMILWGMLQDNDDEWLGTIVSSGDHLIKIIQMLNLKGEALESFGNHITKDLKSIQNLAALIGSLHDCDLLASELSLNAVTLSNLKFFIIKEHLELCHFFAAHADSLFSLLSSLKAEKRQRFIQMSLAHDGLYFKKQIIEKEQYQRLLEIDGSTSYQQAVSLLFQKHPSQLEPGSASITGPDY